MSILQKQKQADPQPGLRARLPAAHRRASPRKIRERGVKVIANAGGVNPVACAREVWARSRPEVAVVLGDDVFLRLDEFLAKGYEMRDMDTGAPLAAIRERILSANAYIGAFPLAEALATGADVVIAGRSTDTALTLAPMVHRFGWQPGRFRQAGRRDHCRPHHRMRRAIDRRQLPGGLADHSRHGQHRLPDCGSRARWLFHGDQTSRRRRPRQHPHREGATALRTGRPEALHHARLRGRFHQHPSGDAGPGPRARQRHPRRPAPALAEAFHQLTPPAGRRSARWSTSWPQALEKARAADRIVRAAAGRSRPGVRRDLHRVSSA